MKILWVTPQLPSRRSGGQVRQFYLLRGLAEQHDVTVITLVQPHETADAGHLVDLGVRVEPVLFVPPPRPSRWRNTATTWRQRLFDRRPLYATVYPLDGLRKALVNTVAAWQPDVVSFELLFAVPLSAALPDDVPWLWTAQNVEAQTMRRRIAGATGLEWLRRRIEASKLAAWEAHWLQRSRGVVAVSTADAAQLTALAPNVAITVVPNGVDSAEFALPTTPPPRQDLLFFGNLGYQPNVEALPFFVNEILPTILEKHPDVRLRIVGPGASPRLQQQLRHPQIDFVGFVDAIRDELWRAAVCVVPLLSGSGTRLKIVEALAAGCPVVSTSVGAEGLRVIDGEHLLLADDRASFAQAVNRLLADAAYRVRLASAGQALVRTQYDWQQLVPYQEQALRDLTRPSSDSDRPNAAPTLSRH